MGTVDKKWDSVIGWVDDPSVPGSHDKVPKYLSEYVQSLENLVRSGDSDSMDLERLRARFGLGPEMGHLRKEAPDWMNRAVRAVDPLYDELHPVSSLTDRIIIPATPDQVEWIRAAIADGRIEVIPYGESL